MKKIISLLLLLILGIFLVGCEKVSSTTASFSPAKAVNPGERKIKTESSTVITTKQTETTVKSTETTTKPISTTTKQITTTKPVETTTTKKVETTTITTTTKPIETTTTQNEEGPVVINLLTYYNNTSVETSEFSVPYIKNDIVYYTLNYVRYLARKTIVYNVINRKTNEVVLSITITLGCSYTEEIHSTNANGTYLTMTQNHVEYLQDSISRIKLQTKSATGNFMKDSTLTLIAQMNDYYNVFIAGKTLYSYDLYQIETTSKNIKIVFREKDNYKFDLSSLSDKPIDTDHYYGVNLEEVDYYSLGRLNEYNFDTNDYFLDVIETVEYETIDKNLYNYSEIDRIE